MKNLKLILVSGIIIALFFSSCSSTVSEKSTQDVYILVDNTEANLDSREDLVTTSEIVEMVKSGGTVTWQNINAVSLNSRKSIEVTLPENPTNFQKMNVLEPFEKEVNEFNKKFLGPVTKGTDNSSIYKPVCQALTTLSKSSAKKQTLIIVSDMIENSQFGNFYNQKQTFAQVKNQLDSSGFSFPKDTRIKVIILYHADNQKHEKQHDKAMRFWQKLFEDADIEFEVRANL